MTLRLTIINLALAATALFAAETTNSLTAITTNAPSDISSDAASLAGTNIVSTNAISAMNTNIVQSGATNIAIVSTNITEAQTSAAVSIDSTKDVVSFSDFKIISLRNIFDPNRRAPRSPGSREEYRKPNRVDYLNLVGAMSYEKGRFAFFDGSSSEYRKSLKPGDSIVGYKISSVNNDKVTLQKDDKKIELPVGGQLKREDEGEWRVNANTESFASSTNSSDSTSSSTIAQSSSNSPGSKSDTSSGPKSDSASDETNPILKRLLEARKQGK